MFCRNCQQDTGNKNTCPHCGYNPALDAEGALPYTQVEQVHPRPVRIVLNKAGNGKAKAAFILSFFGFIILPGIISFFLGLAGFFQGKKCRSGRGMAIFALLIDLFWFCLYSGLIYGIYTGVINGMFG